MSAWGPFTSIIRKGSARLLLGVALLCTVLLMARLHLLAALSLLVAVGAIGAFRRMQEQGVARSAHDGKTAAESFPPGMRSAVGRDELEAKLNAQWSDDQESDEPTSLLLIRMDALAALDQLQQDRSARPSDVAMVTMANALTRMLPREADLLARYDDATFAVVLCGTDLPGSLRVAARLRWAIVRLGIANPGAASGFLTACMGVAVHHGPATGKTPVLMASAEKMLGVAQRLGEDGLEYEVLGGERLAVSGSGQRGVTSRAMPAIRAWTPERGSALHSPQA